MRKRRLPRLLTVLLSVGLLVQNMPLAVLADTLLTATEDSAAKDVQERQKRRTQTLFLTQMNSAMR